MPDRTSRRNRKNPYSDLIHLLNQRYQEQWVRAELLQNELDGMRSTRAWHLAAWLQSLKRCIWPVPPARVPQFTMRAVPYTIPAPIAKPQGRVSIVIPFKDRLELLRNCLRSLNRSAHRQFEVILVDNGSSESRTMRFLSRLERRHCYQIVSCPGEFNFSRLCNAGAARSCSEYLLFLNNDTEVDSPAWLEHLLQPALDRQVGIVGATLLYPNRTIQHAGLFPLDNDLWMHVHRGQPADYPGEEEELLLPRSVPAVTAACLLIRRGLFQEVGGFDERFAVTYNDIDLCARVRSCDKLVVITPYARLLHYEGLSRGITLDTPKCAREVQ